MRTPESNGHEAMQRLHERGARATCARPTALRLGLVGVVTLMAACAPPRPSPSPSASSSPVVTTLAPETPHSSPSGNPLLPTVLQQTLYVVTDADNGRVLDLPYQAILVVRLRGVIGGSWTPIISSDPHVLPPIPDPQCPDASDVASLLRANYRLAQAEANVIANSSSCTARPSEGPVASAAFLGLQAATVSVSADLTCRSTAPTDCLLFPGEQRVTQESFRVSIVVGG